MPTDDAYFQYMNSVEYLENVVRDNVRSYLSINFLVRRQEVERKPF